MTSLRHLAGRPEDAATVVQNCNFVMTSPGAQRTKNKEKRWHSELRLSRSGLLRTEAVEVRAAEDEKHRVSSTPSVTAAFPQGAWPSVATLSFKRVGARALVAPQLCKHKSVQGRTKTHTQCRGACHAGVQQGTGRTENDIAVIRCDCNLQQRRSATPQATPFLQG